MTDFPAAPRTKPKRSTLALAGVAVVCLLLVMNCGDSRPRTFLFLGTSAGDLLTAERYTRLVVEVDYVNTHPPSPGALAVLEARLNERLNKPGGIQIRVDDAIPPVEGPTSLAQIQELERQHRDLVAEGNQVTLYVLYLNDSSAVGSYLGLAYSPTSFCIFKQSIDQSVSQIASPEELERATLVHELGHLLGLVNLGTPMVVDHADPAYPTHDISRLCVMHHEIETTSVRILLQNGGAPPDQFDSRCITDLRAVGGR